MRYVLSLIVASLVLIAQPATAASGSDDAFDRLQRDFKNLYKSLQAQGGIGPEEEVYVNRFRTRVEAFNERNPDHVGGVAMELQIASWLEDHDRVDRLFARLVRLAPDDRAFGRAWINYFLRQENNERVDAIYERLLELRPYDAENRIAWARRLKARNQYPRAIEVLERGSVDLAVNPEAAMVLSDCLFAENRFEEAVEALRSIPEAGFELKPPLRREVEFAMTQRQEQIERWSQELALRAAESREDDLPMVELHIEGRGRIVVELFEDHAPNHVANFLTLAEEGFYDGSKFHRVISNFMAQGGDPNTKPGAEGEPGAGGPGYRIADEVDREDHRLHFAGTLAMAKEPAPDTAGSQFYLTHQPTPHLNGIHTVFGRVVEGLDVVRGIQQNDVLVQARVLRKRDHQYQVARLTADAPALPRTVPQGRSIDDLISPTDPSRRDRGGEGREEPAPEPDGSDD